MKSMKRKCLAVGIILLFVGISIIQSTALDTEKLSPTSRGKWLYVGGSGPGNYTKIQDAVDIASNGDTVFVYNGIYKEQVNIKTSIILKGNNKNFTVINGDGIDWIIHIQHNLNGVTICNFTIENTGKNIPFSAGIELDYESNNNILTNNVFKSCTIGIRAVLQNQGNVISDNIFEVSYGGYSGIWLYDRCTQNVVVNNTVLDTSYGIIVQSSSHNDVRKNYLSGNTQGIYIWLGSDYNLIHDNTITKSKVGIALADIVRYTDIYDNLIIKNRAGIGLEIVSNNNIYKNIIDSNTFGIIFLDRVFYTNVSYNNITNNIGIKGGGIQIWDSVYNIISHNNIVGNIPQARFHYDFAYMKYWDNVISIQNDWNRNYWGENQTKSHLIFGYIGLFAFIPWIQFDRYPEQKPYDIRG
jgi:nitrous oxidase accessory protein